MAQMIRTCVLVGICCGASEPDLMQRWVERSERLDSLYVEGRIDHYRVPIDKDPADPANWEFRPDVCLRVDFTAWLRRPDYRVNIRDLPRENGLAGQNSDYNWLDGKACAVGEYNHPENMGGTFQSDPRIGRMMLEPYLTPMEVNFFGNAHPIASSPSDLAQLPYEIEGNVITVRLDEGSGKNTPMLGRIELDPQRDYCPTRITCVTDFEPPTEDLTWDLHTLETTDVGGMTMIKKARIVVTQRTILPNERVVYLWEAKVIREQPITRADIQIEFPDGILVTDYTTNPPTQWTAGQPGSKTELDPKELALMAEALQAQLGAPIIRAERQTAMTWIVVGAFAVSAAALALALIIRRRRYGART